MDLDAEVAKLKRQVGEIQETLSGAPRPAARVPTPAEQQIAPSDAVQLRRMLLSLTADMGGLVNQMKSLQERVARIEGHPALEIPPLSDVMPREPNEQANDDSPPPAAEL